MLKKVTYPLLVLAALPIMPCLAQEYIYGPLPTVDHSSTTTIQVRDAVPVPAAASTTTTEVVAVPNEVNFDFKERLSNLQLQIDKGLDKGWLTTGQAAAFSTERSSLLGQTNDVESIGFPKAQTDQLEKDITAFSAKVTSAMSKETAGAPSVLK